MNNFKFSLYKKLILKYCGYPNRILDIGCGKNKELGRYFSSSNYIGIDKIFHNDVEHYSMDIPGKFDLIVMSEIFEHLKYPCELMRKSKRLNAKHYLITLPNDYNLFSRLKFLFGFTIDKNAFSYKDKHSHFPTLKQTDDFIKQNFKIVYKTYFSDNFFLPDEFLTWLANLCPTLFARGIIYICQNFQ